ncbi:tyrosine-type recombinase/integrase [Paenibacillus faecalis]|uniref:tyrosine-type recombinase/integrase n=1 Tax=Paenibacillus faecalis TaxID=2079532 RepID=UPI000D10D469|nr:tyrosine-type recombinase/integrase [Paenibacillus faecalis]
MLKLFEQYLIDQDKSDNTINSYVLNVRGFMKWFKESRGIEFKKLYRENVKEYISYLKTIKKNSPSTLNTKISSLIKFNEYLIDAGIQSEQMISKKDMMKIQRQYASLTNVERTDVEKFRQLVLESNSKRNYAIVSLLAYCGLRISEALNIRMDDFHLSSSELVVTEGKGSKSRTVMLSDKVKAALQSWIRERKEKGIQSEYLFPSNRGTKLNRTVINKLFNEYSKVVGKEITPHDLRHFFCTNAIENGMDFHQVASQAGHSNIHTTMLYTNPNKQKLLEMMNKL